MVTVSSETNKGRKFGYWDAIDACLISYGLYLSAPNPETWKCVAIKKQLICELFDVDDDVVLHDIATAHIKMASKLLEEVLHNA